MNSELEPLDLDDRYGRKKANKGNQFGLRTLVIAVFIALVAWLFWSAFYHSNPTVSANLMSFKAVNEKSMGIKFEITRRDRQQPITCRLTAVDIDKFIVGEIQYRIAPGAKHEIIETQIPTRAQSVSASVVRCVVSS